MDISGGNDYDLDSIPIIDSHIHLFPASQLDSLAWNSPSNELWASHTVKEYISSVHSPARPNPKPNLRGFIFVETDRKTSLHDAEKWEQGPLLELQYLISIANDSLSEEDGHYPDGSNLLLGIVPWAPIPAGPRAMEDYISRAKKIAGKHWHLIKGFRYLVQSEPPGTMIGSKFIESLKYLADLELAFDLGIDFRSGGAWQLDEAVDMLKAINAGSKNGKALTVIVNHMCKPPMTGDSDAELVQQWKTKIKSIAAFPNTIVKISGGFSEIDALPKFASADEEERKQLVEEASEEISHFIDSTVDAFGTDRIIFASDWPVCNIGGGGRETAWNDWLLTVQKWSRKRGVSKAEMDNLFWRTARQVYKV